jgi:hypothetical protein
MNDSIAAPGRWVFYLLLLQLAACGSAQRAYVTNSQLQDDGRPRWVVQGSTPVKSKQERLFYGVASTHLAGNFSARTVLADKRAKEEALRELEGYLTVVSRDMLASGGLSEADFVSRVPQQLKSFTGANRSGVTIVGHWRDEKANMLYSIAELNLRHVSDSLVQAQSLDLAFRQYFQAKGDVVFDRIADKARPTTVNLNLIAK